MTESPAYKAKPLADLIGEVLKSIAAKRGFSQAAILSWWPDIVGETYAATTLPERLRWPRTKADPQGATLILAVDPSVALRLATAPLAKRNATTAVSSLASSRTPSRS